MWWIFVHLLSRSLQKSEISGHTHIFYAKWSSCWMRWCTDSGAAGAAPRWDLLSPQLCCKGSPRAPVWGHSNPLLVQCCFGQGQGNVELLEPFSSGKWCRHVGGAVGGWLCPTVCPLQLWPGDQAPLSPMGCRCRGECSRWPSCYCVCREQRTHTSSPGKKHLVQSISCSY